MERKTFLFALLCVAALLLPSCEKDKDFAQREMKVTDAGAVSVYGKEALFSARCDYPGKWTAVLEISASHDMANPQSFDATADGNAITAVATGLELSTSYFGRITASNRFAEAHSEVFAFTTTLEKPANEETFTANGVSFTMILVEGGTFTMGATAEQGSDASVNEEPTHSVTLISYHMGETEVTQALWQAVMGSNPSYFSGSNLPVEQVSWNNCQQFVTKLNQLCASQLNGRQFRLPTEAEWEYAARGGKQSRGYKYSGSNNIGDVAWYDDNSGDKTHAVGTKQANELGLYDMNGNVLEWCQDRYAWYGSSAQTDPTGPSSGSARVNRGGSWSYDAGGCRVSSRGYSYPSNTLTNVGLRLSLR